MNANTAARAVLNHILREIPVRPDDTGKFLVAELKIQATPLMRAAGVGRIGSGARFGASQYRFGSERMAMQS
jgi:hypothetical protein